jgi:hypothetical protein
MKFTFHLAILFSFCAVCLFASESEKGKQSDRNADLIEFYQAALQDPLNVGKLHSQVVNLHQKYQGDDSKLFSKRLISVTDISVNNISASDALLHQYQGVPLLHYFLNVYLTKQSNPGERALLYEIFLLSLELGMDINVAYKDDPPLYYKTLFLKEFFLTDQLISFNQKEFLKEIIARNFKFFNFLKLSYSLTSEVIPVTKLLLHIQKLLSYFYADHLNKQFKYKKDGFQGIEFDSTSVMKKLLESARLDKPTIKPKELLQYSANYTFLVDQISHIHDGNHNILTSDSLLSSLNELVYNSIFKRLTNMLAIHENKVEHNELLDQRKWIAMEHFFDLHCHIHDEPQKRNLFHYLVMSNNHLVILKLSKIWKLLEDHYSSYSDSSVDVTSTTTIATSASSHDAEYLNDIKKRMFRSLQVKDIRGHTPLSYARMRFGKESNIYQVMEKFLSFFGTLIEDAATPDNEAIEGFQDVSSDIDVSSEQDDGGSWDEKTVLIGDVTDSPSTQTAEETEPAKNTKGKERCDILEIWNEVLPSAEEFFAKYINQGKPVIFRNAALMENEKMNLLRHNYQKNRFLSKYGKLKASISPIPYGGKRRFSFVNLILLILFSSESFGVKPITAYLKDIANQPFPISSSQKSIPFSEYLQFESPELSPFETLEKKTPNYVFLTPPNFWGKKFQEDVPTPRPLIVGKENSNLSASFNLSQIATSVQTNAKNVTSYSYELQFYFGSAGTGAPVHYHGHAINTLAYGEKVNIN